MAETLEERRRRLDAVFGDPMPDTTGDERATNDPEDRPRDAELLADRPPHHDRG